MRARVILLLSILLNVALAMMVLESSRHLQRTTPSAIAAGKKAALSSRVGKTNVVIRRLNFNWSDIESSDFRTYIANLRAVGCPEMTIRDIIVADVNQIYDQKRAAEVVTADQQWWRSEPDPDVLEAAANRQQAIEVERRNLLTQLLGPGWDIPTPFPKASDSPPYDGPVLGKMSPEAKAALRRIEEDSSARQRAYLESLGTNAPPSAAELARMRQETRNQLALLLTREQLEEYLLRYSFNAQNLRGELKGFGATPEEFRSIFRARDALDQQIQAYYNSDDPAAQKKRAELERVKEEALQQALGPARYPLYKLTQDPLFRQAQQSAEDAGVPADKVLPIYQVNRLSQQEAERIQKDAALTPEQKTAALQAVESQTKSSIQKILGVEEQKAAAVTK